MVGQYLEALDKVSNHVLYVLALQTIKLLQKVPENTRWDVFLGSLLTQNTHSAFAALLSVFERGRVKVCENTEGATRTISLA